MRWSAVKEYAPGELPVYESVLNVPGRASDLCEAVAQVWQSVLASDGEQGAAAVVIQQQLAPDIAGVLFTANPTNACDETMVVEAVWGLGVGLEQGELVSATALVHWRTQDVEIAPHEPQMRKVVPGGSGGLAWAPTTAEEQQASPLADSVLVRNLSAVGVDIARHFGEKKEIRKIT